MEYFAHTHALVETSNIGKGTRIWAFAHILPGAVIGSECNICDHTFIENDVVVGDRVTIKCGVQLWDGVRLEDDVFIGPNVTFTNDKFPRSKKYPEKFLNTIVKRGASIGANATILPGVIIGEGAMIGAGSVVTKDVLPHTTVVGIPARTLSTETHKNTRIHPSAIISPNAIIGENVTIHPYVIIGDGVCIADNAELYPYTYLGKEPKGVDALSRQPIFEKRTIIGENCLIGPHATIYYDVEIGNNTLVGDNTSIREKVSIGHHSIIGRHVTISYNTQIGNNSKIMDGSHITGNAFIGNDVFIAPSVSTANDNSIAYSRQYIEQNVRGPRIEDGATIGLGAKLLPGVVIGKGALVAAGAVVTKDVSPSAMAKGIPAQIFSSIK